MKTGTTPNATSILTLKPMPTRPAASNRGLRRPVSTARVDAQAASSNVSTSKVSVLFERSTATAIGVKARNRAAKRPAAVPNTRRTRWYSTKIDARPSRACGSKTLNALKAEEFRTEGLGPEGEGRFVEQYKAGRVECIKEEI